MALEIRETLPLKEFLNSFLDSPQNLSLDLLREKTRLDDSLRYLVMDFRGSFIYYVDTQEGRGEGGEQR